MTKMTLRLIKHLSVLLLIMMLLVETASGRPKKGRKKLCRYQNHKDKCIDILPYNIRKNLKQWKRCPGFDIRKERSCAKLGGKCEKLVIPGVRTMCECRIGDIDF